MKRKFLMALALSFCFVQLTFGQTPTFPDIATLTPENLFEATVEPLYGLSVLLFGYISAFIPGVNRLSPFLRVFAFALAVGLGAALFGGAGVWKIALTYFLTSGLYATFFKNIFASPKAALKT